MTTDPTGLLARVRQEARDRAATRHLVAENDLLREVIADMSVRLKEAEGKLAEIERWADEYSSAPTP